MKYNMNQKISETLSPEVADQVGGHSNLEGTTGAYNSDQLVYAGARLVELVHNQSLTDLHLVHNRSVER